LYQQEYHRHSHIREVEAASAAARQAGKIALGYWNKGLIAETKSDASPVTIADRECEQAISRVLIEAFPEDGLLGEEGAAKNSPGGRRWIIDPIDGTRDFVRGNPAWAVLIGLEEAGEVVVGVSYLPAMDEMFIASRGEGAFLNGVLIRASEIADPSQAVLCVNGFNTVGGLAFAPGLLPWMAQLWAVRSMGGCLDAMMVARGQAEVWLEVSGKPWDFAALKIIAEEAGAKFFNFDGGSSIYGGNCMICAPGMETMARQFVSASV